MPLDPSIYNQVGKVNLGQGIGDALTGFADRQNRLSDLARQQETQARQGQLQDLQIRAAQRTEAAIPKAEKQRHIQELAYGLSQGLDPSHGIDKQTLQSMTMREAKRRGLGDEDVNQLFAPLASGKDDASLSQYYLSMANPEEAQKRQIEAQYRKPEKPDDIQLEPVIGRDGKPTLVPRQKAVGMQPYRASSTNINLGATGKPMPPAALRMQNDALDAIGTANALQADLLSFKKEVDAGGLPLGPVQNKLYEAQNWAGKSSPESQKYASFIANLERLRNESLRLNKGVQTEGDAVRAWNEVMKNINDPKLVSARLAEVAKINARASDLRKLEVDQIRANYGNPSLDTGAYENQPTAFEYAPASPTKTQSGATASGW